MPFRRTPPSSSSSPQPEPEDAADRSGVGEDPILRRWLAHTEQQQRQREQGGGAAAAIWPLAQTPAFAHLWYSAREAGERLRAQALTQLYRSRGSSLPATYPDPREPAAFSAQAILQTAIHQQGIEPRIARASMDGRMDGSVDGNTAGSAAGSAAEGDDGSDSGGQGRAQQPHQQHPLAWFISFPAAPLSSPFSSPHSPMAANAANITNAAARHIPPQLWLHPVTNAHPLGLILFAAACLLGYITKERSVLLDPYAPHGVVTLPNEAGVTTIMHQFAIALLGLEPTCPPEWGCACNIIRERFTTPPADHQQPTMTLSMNDLRAAAAQQQQQQQPQPQSSTHPVIPPPRRTSNEEKQ